MFINTKKGNKDTKTDLINNFEPSNADFKQSSGLNII